MVYNMARQRNLVLSALVVAMVAVTKCRGFLTCPSTPFVSSKCPRFSKDSRTKLPFRGSVDLNMVDFITTMRTEYISAALCTNQTPRTAEVCLQLAVQDGRAIYFVPETIKEIITSSAEPDGEVPISAKRQLKQQQERRQTNKVIYHDQRADDLRETANESVDVVISLQATQLMIDNGLDWRKSVREAARVLKPGGRLLFVEPTKLEGVEYVYLDYVRNLMKLDDEKEGTETTDSLGNATATNETAVSEKNEDDRVPVFDEVGYDDIDLIFVPHFAGVAIKAVGAGMTQEEYERQAAIDEKARLADKTIEAYERGIKRRRRKKKRETEATEKS